MEKHKEFLKWAKDVIGKNTDMMGRKLKICYFHDGEPFIGTYPSLRYSVFIKEIELLTNTN